MKRGWRLRKPILLGIHVQKTGLMGMEPPLRSGCRRKLFLIKRDQEAASDTRGAGPLGQRARGVKLLEGDGSWPAVTNRQVNLGG